MACSFPAEAQVWCPPSDDPSDCCEQHNQTLSVFCLDDLEPLCQQCAAECHSQHRVYLLTEAVTDCKGELHSSLNNLKEKMSGFEKVTQSCQHVSKHNEAAAVLAEEHIKKEFELLHQILLKEEADRLLMLRQEKEKKMRELHERTKHMDERVRSLEERIRLTEAELDSGGDGGQFLKHYQEPTKRPCNDLKKKPQKPFLINVAKHLGNLRFSVWNKMKHIAPYSPVTLDPRTAGQGLAVPYHLNSVHSVPEATQQELLCVPANPERFQPYSSVLAREGFHSGEHCWEIEVGDSNNWTVGVAAQSIPRQEHFEACPEAGLWCISLRDGQYLALTSPAQTLPLDTSHSLKRIRVRLHWDEGLLEFGNADTDTSIFTFTHGFSERVYPYFESISKAGSLSLVAQEASVSVTLDGINLEESVIADDFQETKDNSAEIDRSQDTKTSKSKERKNKQKKLTIKKVCIKTKPEVKQVPSKIIFSEDYHVSLFRSLKIINTQHNA